MGGWTWLIWTLVCIAAAAATVAGGLLLAFAFAGKRGAAAHRAEEPPHGRCDCCGYQLDGLENGYCPECGWRYADNRRLPLGRRIRLALGGAGLLALAGIAAAAPQIANHGWLSILPDWTLIASLPLAPGGDPAGNGPGGVSGGPAAAVINLENGSELHRVLRARLDRDGLSASRRAWLAEQCAGVIARSHDEPARLAAAALLARVAGTDVRIPEMIAAGVDDPSARVRERVVDAIGRLAAGARDERARQPLVADLLGAAVCDSDGGVRREAVEALGRLDSSRLQGREVRSVAGVLSRSARDSCPAVRMRTLYVLSTRGPAMLEIGAADAWDLESLKRAAHDPHPGVREAAVFAISRVGGAGDEIVALLGEALHDSASQVREMAASALARLGQRAGPVASTLVERLYDEDPSVQSAAGRALGAIGS